MISTYADLKAAITSRSSRADLVPLYPEFIQLAEARIGRRLAKLLGGEVATTLPLTAGVDYVELPADFGAARRASISNASTTAVLVYKTPAQLYEEYPNDAARLPRAFTVTGSDGMGGARLVLRP